MSRGEMSSQNDAQALYTIHTSQWSYVIIRYFMPRYEHNNNKEDKRNETSKKDLP